jgi:hypothetical protein
MSLKISANQSAVAHHIVDGPFTFPYAVDAKSAMNRFPKEWSDKPWSMDATIKARQAKGEPDLELTGEELAAIEEHAKAVAEAGERLKAFQAKKAAEKAEADQVTADEAIVNSPAPRPEPRVKPLSPAQIRKRAAETDDERIVREKAEADAQAAAGITITG